MNTSPTRSALRDALHSQDLAGRFGAHTARWSFEEWQSGHWWIKDGEVQVGLVVRGADFAELVNFDPFAPRRDIPFPAIYHAPTQPGDRVTLACWLDSQSTTSDHHELLFALDENGVTATFSERWNDGRRAVKRLMWTLDADWGYMIRAEAHLSAPRPLPYRVGAPPVWCNFLPRGVTDDRPENSRYPYVLWLHPSGEIVRWNQNNIGARALGALDIHDRRRLQSGGFLGFFGESDYDIAVEVVDSSPGATALTCPQMLDEHLAWLPPEVEPAPLDESGRSTYRTLWNLVCVPPALGATLTAQAKPLDMVIERRDAVLEERHAWCDGEYPTGAGGARTLRVVPLQTGVPCDFETRLDAAATFRGVVFPYGEDVDEPISVVSDCAHSGQHSLCLRPGHPKAGAGPLQTSTRGSCLHVTRNQKYRLSAWIKTDLQEGEARLQAVEFIFSLATTTAVHQSAPVGGRTEWQEVALEFTPGEQAHVVDVRFEASGRGRAWVDDILLEKIAS